MVRRGRRVVPFQHDGGALRASGLHSGRRQRAASRYGRKVRGRGAAPASGAGVGSTIDYSPPVNFSALLAGWANQTGPHATMGYSTFRAALQALDVGAPNVRVVKGERPNLWYIEGCPPHHNLCT